jgi:hypothetical protein
MVGKIMMLDWRSSLALAKWVFLIYPLFLFAIGLATSQMLVLPFGMWLSAVYSFKPFQMEEQIGLNNLYMTLPATRGQIVKARYGFAFIMMVFGIVMGLAVMPVVRHFSNSSWYIGVEGHIAVVAVGVLLFSVIIFCMYPLLFKIGYEKGKIVGLIIPTLVFYLALFGYYLYMAFGNRNITLDFIVYASRNMLWVSGGLFVSAALIFSLSFWLSLRAYKKRDL